MNIHIDNFDVDKLNPIVFTLMAHLHQYLDDGWKIHKKTPFVSQPQVLKILK